MKIFPNDTWTEWNKTTEELRTSSTTFRLELLEDIEKQVKVFTEEVFKALSSDLSKPRTESLLTEIAPVIQEIGFFKKNLSDWMKPKKVKSPLTLLGTSNWTKYEGKGKVLILSPWNYPFRLAMNPVIAAIAAGNSVCLKASEHSGETTKIIYKILSSSKAERFIKCFSGGPEVAKELLSLPFNHVFFTGGTNIGRDVMRQAAENLIPVTLELGGKSPTFILSDADLKTSVERILWGKYMNAGQTCVAPDYVLLSEDMLTEFKSLVSQTLKRFYGEDAKASASYARMITENHAATIISAIDETDKEKIIYGGSYELKTKYIEPTVILNPSLDSKLMKQEIFGPVLPVMTYRDLKDAIKIVQNYDKPLALYVFTQNQKSFSKITGILSSGAALMNTVATHLANPYLPFGGVGASGIGKYHGRFGFEELSHLRSYQKVPAFSILKSFLPPYEKLEKKLESWKEVLYKL